MGLNMSVILPPLFQRLRRQAPAVVIESFLSHRRETTSDLAAGRLEYLSYLKGVERIDGYTIRYHGDDIVDVSRFIQFVVGYNSRLTF